MQKVTGQKDKACELKRPIAFGLIGIVILLLLLLISSFLISGSILAQGREVVTGWVSLFLAGITASALSGRNAKSKKGAHSLISGGVILSFIIFLSALNKNSSIFNLNTAVDFGILTFAALLGSITAAKKTKKRRFR